MGQSYFDFMGLQWDASVSEVEAAYKLLRKQWAADPTRLEQLEHVHNTLTTFKRRMAYIRDYEAMLARDGSDSGLDPRRGDQLEVDMSPTDPRSGLDVTCDKSSWKSDRDPSQSHIHQQSPGGRAQRHETQLFEPRPELLGGEPPSAVNRGFQSPKPEASQPNPVMRPRRSPTGVPDRSGSFEQPTELQRDERRTSKSSRSQQGSVQEPEGRSKSSSERKPTVILDGSERAPNVMLEFEGRHGELDRPSSRAQSPNTPAGSAPPKHMPDSGSESQPNRQSGSVRRHLTEVVSSQPGPAKSDSASDETIVGPAVRSDPPPSSQGSTLSQWVVVVEYQGPPATMQLKPGDNLVGRPPLGGPSPDVSLPDPKKFISRKHAVLRVANGQVYIIDKGSDNGTRVNGRRIDEEKPYLLEIGRDRIEIEGRVLVVRESRAG